ncbi:MAG: hypothetical protein JWP69_1964 [Flaviaesturariibacter sp.]|nr:hypothetical protein [Flaviaesturariibacter sp.]
MAAPSLDSEFMQYWAQLTVVQKTSLLSVIKSFVQEGESISLEQYNREIDEAVADMQKGEVVSHADVIRLSKEW